ncbi:hypothetical protein HanRHA438_Chr12g0541351 [Helianthus annuus]|nr:hypothetical protein HanRHA438_Chr12g0541351 [Helianthus annuus]
MDIHYKRSHRLVDFIVVCMVRSVWLLSTTKAENEAIAKTTLRLHGVEGLGDGALCNTWTTCQNVAWC